MQLPSVLSQFLEGRVGVAEVVIWSHAWHSAACVLQLVLDTVQLFCVLHIPCVYSPVISPPQLTWRTPIVLVIRDLVSYSYPTLVSDYSWPNIWSTRQTSLGSCMYKDLVLRLKTDHIVKDFSRATSKHSGWQLLWCCNPVKKIMQLFPLTLQTVNASYTHEYNYVVNRLIGSQTTHLHGFLFKVIGGQ